MIVHVFHIISVKNLFRWQISLFTVFTLPKLHLFLDYCLQFIGQNQAKRIHTGVNFNNSAKNLSNALKITAGRGAKKKKKKKNGTPEEVLNPKSVNTQNIWNKTFLFMTETPPPAL